MHLQLKASQEVIELRERRLPAGSIAHRDHRNHDNQADVDVAHQHESCPAKREVRRDSKRLRHVVKDEVIVALFRQYKENVDF